MNLPEAKGHKRLSHAKRKKKRGTRIDPVGGMKVQLADRGKRPWDFWDKGKQK